MVCGRRAGDLGGRVLSFNPAAKSENQMPKGRKGGSPSSGRGQVVPPSAFLLCSGTG